MKIIVLSLLTLVLVSCGEIRFEVGEDDSGEVGTYVWMPQPDTPRLDRFGNPIVGEGVPTAYLVNTRTGVVQRCRKADSDFICVYNASPTNTPVEHF